MALMDGLAPTDAPHRRGAQLGFDGTQGRANIYRSILEGIALTMVGHVTAVESAIGRHLSTLIVSGGGSRPDVMMQILADVFARPTRRTAMSDEAGLGAPDPDRVEAYREIRQVYARLTDYTDSRFVLMDAVGAQRLS